MDRLQHSDFPGLGRTGGRLRRRSRPSASSWRASRSSLRFWRPWRRSRGGRLRRRSRPSASSWRASGAAFGFGGLGGGVEDTGEVGPRKELQPVPGLQDFRLASAQQAERARSEFRTLTGASHEILLTLCEMRGHNNALALARFSALHTRLSTALRHLRDGVALQALAEASERQAEGSLAEQASESLRQQFSASSIDLQSQVQHALSKQVSGQNNRQRGAQQGGRRKAR
mmetsp:Transcript_102693/g.329169  ORF Transcript_102693/g.329169 Transcript_102693/m.329169 type:complete len:229 (-) Transcript_102693:177-863(-)